MKTWSNIAAVVALVAMATVGRGDRSSGEVLPFTRYETASIPCAYGDGDVRNLSWYRVDNESEHDPLVIRYYQGQTDALGDYVGRADLADDHSTLLLSNVSIADEGSYWCDVDIVGGTPVDTHDTPTNLRVYGLASGSAPIIEQCSQSRDTNATRQSECTLNVPSRQYVELRCALPNVYPSNDVTIEWHKAGTDSKCVETSFSQRNETVEEGDGSSTIIAVLTVRISNGEVGWVCEASFPTAGGWQTGKALVVSTDEPITSTSVMPSGGTEGGWKYALALVAGVAGLVVVFVVAMICRIRYIRRKSMHARLTRPRAESKLTLRSELEETEFLNTAPASPTVDNRANPTDPFSSTLININGSADPMNTSQRNELDPSVSTLPGADEYVTDVQLMELSKIIPVGQYQELSIHLGTDSNTAENILVKHQRDTQQAVLEVLMAWQNRTGGPREELNEALEQSGLGGLVEKF